MLRAGIVVLVELSFLLSSPNARGSVAEGSDILSAKLPPGWHRRVLTVPHSRTWTFSPAELPPDEEKGEVENDVKIAVQLDVPKSDLAKPTLRESADALFQFKTKVYRDAHIELKAGPVADHKIAGVDALECDFTNPEGGVEETIVGTIGKRLLLVTFSYPAKYAAADIDIGHQLMKSLAFDLGESLVKAKATAFHDSKGSCVIALPATWKTHEKIDGSSRTLTIAPVLPTDDDPVTGCTALIWPHYSRSAPGDLSGTDEKVRDGWTALAGYVVEKGDKAVPLPIGKVVIAGVEGNRVEVARGKEDGSGPASHALHFIASKDDTLLDITFRASELEWPRYEALFEKAFVSLELNVGNAAVLPTESNGQTGRYGNALLLADLLAKQLPKEYITVLDPAPRSSAGWQTPNDRRRVMLAMRAGQSVKDVIAKYSTELPPDWPSTTVFQNDLTNDCSEVGITVKLPNGRESFAHMLAGDAGEGYVYCLQLTLSPDDEEGKEALKPLIDVFVKNRPKISVATDHTVTFGAPHLRARFTPPKAWRTSFDRCRAAISFTSESEGTAALEVRHFTPDFCYVNQGEAMEKRLAELTSSAKIEKLGSKKIPGSKAGPDHPDTETTEMRTLENGDRVWSRTRTVNQPGYAVSLVVEIPLKKADKATLAEQRAAPIFASLKVDPGTP